MDLSLLQAEFIRREVRPNESVQVQGEDGVVREVLRDAIYHIPVGSIAEADGVEFLCPKCFVANGGRIGTHMVICWRPRVPAEALPGPGRWEFEGNGINDLTLRASSSSILLAGETGCHWHGYITNGKVTNA